MREATPERAYDTKGGKTSKGNPKNGTGMK
jgi:hypothetical protein